MFRIKKLILDQSFGLSIFALCDSLYVSYSTIKSLISKMNHMFNNYQVSFVCENNCIYMEGDERDKRRLISYIVTEESSFHYLNIENLAHSFPSLDMNLLYEKINQLFQTYECYINDFAKFNLLLHLAILINRSLQGNSLLYPLVKSRLVKRMNMQKIPGILICPNYRNIEVELVNQLMLNFGHEIEPIIK